MVNQNFENITYKKEADNVVKFSNSIRIEFFGGRVVIHRVSDSSVLELSVRPSDCQGTPGFKVAYWDTEPKWSNGKALSRSEVIELQHCIKNGALAIGQALKQKVKYSGEWEFIDV